MINHKTNENTLDAIALKREAQQAIYEEIKHLTPEQEVAYFRKAASTGPLSSWWNNVRTKRELETA